jgi:hypothetical protein
MEGQNHQRCLWSIWQPSGSSKLTGWFSAITNAQFFIATIVGRWSTGYILLIESSTVFHRRPFGMVGTDLQ